MKNEKQTSNFNVYVYVYVWIYVMSKCLCLNRKTTYFDVFCLNFSIETKIIFQFIKKKQNGNLSTRIYLHWYNCHPDEVSIKSSLFLSIKNVVRNYKGIINFKGVLSKYDVLCESHDFTYTPHIAQYQAQSGKYFLSFSCFPIYSIRF